MIALLCAGQGRQHADMFRLTRSLPEARVVLQHASRLLGEDILLACSPSHARRFENRTAQVLCTTSTLLHYSAVRDILPARVCIAGYSVGEVAAWGLALDWPAGDVVTLAAHRAQAMDAARIGDQAMLSVRGVTPNDLARLCALHRVAVAIFNPNDAYVVAGRKQDLELFRDAAIEHGAQRVITLEVTIASHTPLMQEAVSPWREHLDAMPYPRVIKRGARLISGIDGATVFDVERGKEKLVQQLVQPIRWDACIQACVEAGATAFLELGPGHALTDMVQSAHPQFAARSMDAFSTIEGACAWVRQNSA